MTLHQRKFLTLPLLLTGLALQSVAASASGNPTKTSGDSGFKALCLLNPADGQALLPGYTVGDFLRKGRTSGRLKAILVTKSGDSHILRFLVVDQLSLKVTPVSLQFGEVGPGPNCGGKRAAQLESASFNFQRVNAANAMVGAVSVMYAVIKEELEKKLSAPQPDSRRNAGTEHRPAPAPATAIPCSGFYAYIPPDRAKEVAFSIEVQPTAIDLKWLDYGTSFARKVVENDKSVTFHMDNGGPSKLTCSSSGAVVVFSADAETPRRTYRLTRSRTDIWGIARERKWAVGD
jgi:hypothetical protein